MPDAAPKTLSEALVALQAQLPRIPKTDEAQVGTRSAAAAFTDHWAGCDWCQEGLPCPEGDPLWVAMEREAARGA